MTGVPLRPVLALLAAASAVVLTAQTAAPPRRPMVLDHKTLRYPPLKPVAIPTPEVFTLSNGMKVFLLENHELPLINGFALIRTGNLFDPPDKRGLSEIMAGVLRSGGTPSKTGDQIDEELENIAASVESLMGESSASVSFSLLKEHRAQVLAIVRDLLSQPEFRPDKLELLKTQVRSSISRRNDDPSAIARREFLAQIYGSQNPYGWRVEYEHVDGITREDLISFHRRYYFPANIRLAISGDFETAEMKRLLEQIFSGWNTRRPAVEPFPAVTAQPRAGIFLAEKKDVTQTFFAIGHLGGTLDERDYPALQVAADILGSGFTSRLVNRVRTKLGYAYEVGASWNAGFRHPGVFQIGGSTKSASTTETIAAIREEIEKMRAAEVTPQELATAKNAVLNSFVFRFDRPEKTLNRLVQYDYHGYPPDFLRRYQQGVESVTRADVLRVARERFRPDLLTIVAVGNPKEFGKPLSSLGAVEKIDLAIPDPPRPQEDHAGGERLFFRKFNGFQELIRRVKYKFNSGFSAADLASKT